MWSNAVLHSYLEIVVRDWTSFKKNILEYLCSTSGVQRSWICSANWRGIQHWLQQKGEWPKRLDTLGQIITKPIIDLIYHNRPAAHVDINRINLARQNTVGLLIFFLLFYTCCICKDNDESNWISVAEEKYLQSQCKDEAYRCIKEPSEGAYSRKGPLTLMQLVLNAAGEEFHFSFTK